LQRQKAQRVRVAEFAARLRDNLFPHPTHLLCSQKSEGGVTWQDETIVIRPHHAMGTAIMDTAISRRLSGVMELVEEVAFGRMDERLMDYLVEKSEDGRLETTHQRIAADLGTSREVISRLLKDFERKQKLPSHVT
jgi:CRP-like cAMP-binding protein